MSSKFSIAYQIEAINKDVLNEDPGYTVFMMSAITGTAKISSGGQVVDIKTCGLLRLSSSLIYLCVMPLMYKMGVNESRLDEVIDMTSSLENGQIKLGLHGSPYRTTTNFYVPPMDALAEVGKFQTELVQSLFSANNALRVDSRVREYLFFASDNLLK